MIMKVYNKEIFKKELLLVEKQITERTCVWIDDLRRYLNEITELKTGDSDGYKNLLTKMTNEYKDNRNFIRIISSLCRIGDFEINGVLTSCFLKKNETQIKEDVINLLISSFNPELTYKNSYGVDFQEDSQLYIETLIDNSTIQKHLDYFKDKNVPTSENDLVFLINAKTLKENEDWGTSFEEIKETNINYICMRIEIDDQFKVNRIHFEGFYKGKEFFTYFYQIHTPTELFSDLKTSTNKIKDLELNLTNKIKELENLQKEFEDFKYMHHHYKRKKK